MKKIIPLEFFSMTAYGAFGEVHTFPNRKASAVKVSVSGTWGNLSAV
jgi:hypothetical protein